MKKIFFVAALFMALSAAAAQSTKVAIMDIVDRNSQIEYNTKLMLSSYIAEAVTNTPGYEAYDHLDISDIIDEYEFQRTGFISSNDISEIGKKTSVQQILIVEVSKIKSRKLFVTAKLHNVTTKQLESAVNTTTSTKVESIQQGIRALTTQLFANINADKRPKLIHNPWEIRKAYNRKEFSYGNREMSEDELFSFLYEKSPETYVKLKKAKQLKIAGWVLGGCTAMSVLPLYVPCLTEGYKQYKKAIEYFNTYCNTEEVEQTIQKKSGNTSSPQQAQPQSKPKQEKEQKATQPQQQKQQPQKSKQQQTKQQPKQPQQPQKVVLEEVE